MSVLLGHAQAANIISKQLLARSKAVQAEINALNPHDPIDVGAFERKATVCEMLLELAGAFAHASLEMNRAVRDQCSPGPAAPGEPG